MIWLFSAVAVLVVTLGALYGTVTPVGPWDGMYFAVVTVTTVGYGDIVPRGWEAHLVALAIMVMIIPLWSAVFSLLTSGIVADHVDRRHEEMKDHVSDAGQRS
jgi:voltage-gated potassium channel